MTKKRFIKLLMSNGVQRNGAYELAVLYNIKGYSYKRAFRNFRIILRLKRSFVMLADSAKRATRAFDEMTSAMKGIKNEHE